MSYPPIDFAIVTIREDEHEAALSRFPAEIPDTPPELRNYNLRAVSTSAGDRVVAIVRTIEQGNIAALDVAHDLITTLRPRWLMVVGIAGGVPEREFTLGDVILSSHIYDLTLEATGPGGAREFSLKGGGLHKDAARVVANLCGLRNQLGDWSSESSIGLKKPPVGRVVVRGDESWQARVRDSIKRHFPHGRPDRLSTVTARPIASSDRLVKDPELIGGWQEVIRHVAAVEMESAGIYRAAMTAGVPFVAIRGLSDIVGLKRDPAWTEYACATGAAFARALIGSGAIPLPPRRVKRPRPSPPLPEADAKQDARRATEAAYRDYLVRACGRVPLLFSTRSVALERLFVPPSCESTQGQYDVGTAEIPEDSDGGEDDWNTVKPMLTGRRVSSYELAGSPRADADVGHALREVESMIVSGNPGAGKTTLLRYLALTFAQRKAEERLQLAEDRWPILASLAKLPGLDSDRALDLVTWLEDVVASAVPGLPSGTGTVAQALVDKRCIVLLDGFDEIQRVDPHGRVARAVSDLAVRYPGNRFIVASRRHALDHVNGQAIFVRFSEVLLCPFDQTQCERFAHNYFDNAGDPARSRHGTAGRLVAGLKSDPHVAQLASNPLTLSVLAALHRSTSDLPRTRLALFESCAGLYLEHSHKLRDSRGVSSAWATMSLASKRSLVGGLALWCHEHGTILSTQRSVLQSVVVKLLRQADHSPSKQTPDGDVKAGQVLDDLVASAGLLVPKAPDEYTFSHLVFQEYFAAIGIAARQDACRYISDKVESEWWHEPLVFSAALLSTDPTKSSVATGFVRAVYDPEQPPPPSSQALRMLLAARCVAECAPGTIDEGLKEQIAEDLARLWRDEGAHDVRSRTAEVINHLLHRDGGESLRRELLRLLNSPNKTDRWLALDVFARLGRNLATPQVIADLSRIAADVGAVGRVSAVYALQLLLPVGAALAGLEQPSIDADGDRWGAWLKGVLAVERCAMSDRRTAVAR